MCKLLRIAHYASRISLLCFFGLLENVLFGIKGIDIGTGAIEKGGDLVICRRFKTRGMRWSRAGAEAVLQYRLFVLNNEWDTYWNMRRTA
jgi:hypothetical protein